MAELPGQAYNPLFLHAPPGLGKTHLMHAIGNYVLAFGGGATVRYTTAEAFTNQFMSALRTSSLEPFKHAYRDADVLLIDDVQFLASKARTGEEFFHTFDALYQTGRQLVLTCDRLPRSMLDIEQRLRERFEAGLVADISPPDHATRVAILRKRAALDGVVVSDPAVLELIAERVTTNIRSLEGALIRVVAFHSLTQRPIDLELATEVMDTMYPIRGRTQPTISDVQAVVAARYCPLDGRAGLGRPHRSPGLAAADRDPPGPGAHRRSAADHRRGLRRTQPRDRVARLQAGIGTRGG